MRVNAGLSCAAPQIQQPRHLRGREGPWRGGRGARIRSASGPGMSTGTYQAMGGHGAAVGFGPEHHCHNLEGFHGKSAWGQRRCTVLLPRAQLLRAECMGTGKEGARVTAWLATGAAT